MSKKKAKNLQLFLFEFAIIFIQLLNTDNVRYSSKYFFLLTGRNKCESKIKTNDLCVCINDAPRYGVIMSK